MAVSGTQKTRIGASLMGTGRGIYTKSKSKSTSTPPRSMKQPLTEKLVKGSIVTNLVGDII